MRRSVMTALVIGIPFILVLLVLTLSPRPLQDRIPVFLDLVLDYAQHTLGWTWLGFTVLERVANVLVFIPVGVIAALIVPRGSWPLAFLVGPLLSAVIETVQGLALSHRAATLSDLVMNSLGAAVGVCLVLLIRGIGRAFSGRSVKLEAP